MQKSKSVPPGHRPQNPVRKVSDKRTFLLLLLTNNGFVQLRRCEVAFLKDVQFAFRNLKLCEAALQADHQFWEYPHDGHVQSFKSGKMESYFSIEDALLIGLTRFTGHQGPLPEQGYKLLSNKF